MKEKFEKLFKDYEKLLKKSEKEILKDFKKVLEGSYILLSEYYRKYEEDGKLTYSEMAKYNRLEQFFNQLDIIVNEGYKKSYKGIEKVLVDTYKLNYNGTKNIIELTTQRSLIPIVKDEVIQRALTNDISGLKWTQRMNLHRDTAVLKIRETVAQGLHQGETYSTMSKRLNDSLSKQVINPLRIVRTESHRVFSEARKDSLDKAKNKVNMTKTWITARDERVRGRNPKDTMDHVSMDGVTIPYNDDFQFLDGSKGFAPGQIGNYNDINCRCDWIIDFVDDELGGLSSGDVLGEPDEPIFVEKIDTVDYNIAKDKLIEYENDIVDKSYENAYVITKDGEVYRFEGQQASVNPIKLGDKLKGSYVTHNHPYEETEYTFSDDDLDFFINNNIKYLRGVDYKYIYEMSNGLFESDPSLELDLFELNAENYHHINFIEKTKSRGISYRRRKYG